MRVVIAEDLALLREGIVALLRDAGIDVVAQAEDAEGLLRIVSGHNPDVAIVDVRLPPSFTDEGLRAALEARRRQPGLGVLILSQYVESVYTSELLASSGDGGGGYLLKERVGDVRGFLDAIERVAAGGTALDRSVVAELVHARDGGVGVFADLTPREREVMELMAEGKTNAGIARPRPRRARGRHARRRGLRQGTGRRRPRGERAARPAPARPGARRPVHGREPAGRGDHRPRGAAVRVVIAEDLALLREGIVALLREAGIDVVAQAEDGEGLLRIIGGHKPDVAIVDVRLPPGFTDEGLRAALEARKRQPQLGVLILSAYVEPVYTSELLASSGEGGIGYLLKERDGDVRGFLDALERVAEGGTALDRAVVSELMHARDGGGALAQLTPREREVLELMAEGRTNAAIARAMVVQPGAVEKHISSIFSKLDLPAGDDHHRRVLAVLAYLRGG